MTMDDEKDLDQERMRPAGEQAGTPAATGQDRDLTVQDAERTQPTGEQAGGHATATYPDDSRGGFDLLGDGELASVRDRWAGVQATFVDDPAGAARQADTMVGEMLDRLQRRHRELHEEAGGRTNGEADTEAHRIQFLRYRSFLRTLLG